MDPSRQRKMKRMDRKRQFFVLEGLGSPHLTLIFVGVHIFIFSLFFGRFRDTNFHYFKIGLKVLFIQLFFPRKNSGKSNLCIFVFMSFS